MPNIRDKLKNQIQPKPQMVPRPFSCRVRQFQLFPAVGSSGTAETWPIMQWESKKKTWILTLKKMVGGMLWFLLFVLYRKMYLQHPALNTSRHSHHRALRHRSPWAAPQNWVCGHCKAILCPEALPSPWPCRTRTNTSHVSQRPPWTPSHTAGWPHTATSRPARLLVLRNCSGCYTPQGHNQ